ASRRPAIVTHATAPENRSTGSSPDNVPIPFVFRAADSSGPHREVRKLPDRDPLGGRDSIEIGQQLNPMSETAGFPRRPARLRDKSLGYFAAPSQGFVFTRCVDDQPLT